MCAVLSKCMLSVPFGNQTKRAVRGNGFQTESIRISGHAEISAPERGRDDQDDVKRPGRISLILFLITTRPQISNLKPCPPRRLACGRVVRARDTALGRWPSLFGSEPCPKPAATGSIAVVSSGACRVLGFSAKIGGMGSVLSVELRLFSGHRPCVRIETRIEKDLGGDIDVGLRCYRCSGPGRR